MILSRIANGGVMFELDFCATVNYLNVISSNFHAIDYIYYHFRIISSNPSVF